MGKIEDTSKQAETQHLSYVLQVIGAEKNKLQIHLHTHSQQFYGQAKTAEELKIKTGSVEALAETSMATKAHEQALTLAHHRMSADQKRIIVLGRMKESPYFARIDFREDEAPETLYIGIASLYQKDSSPLIVDWRAPIANLYYEGEIGPAYYETQDGKIDVELLLKRQYKIEHGELLFYYDADQVIGDDFLLDILSEDSNDHMKNIVSTIQKEQNRIIRDTHSKIMLIQGIAGSGKTSSLLQRVAYLLYHHRKWLTIDQVLMFSPNNLFSEYISTVLPSLGEDELPTTTLTNFVNYLLKGYQIQQDNSEAAFLAGNNDEAAYYKNSFQIFVALEQYLKDITAVGPIFKDIRLKKEIIFSKQLIREIYQQTNPNLKVHQRLALTAEQLLERLKKIMQQERHKKWIKDQVQAQILKIYEKDPNLADDQQTIQRLEKRLSKQLTARIFRRITRQIKRKEIVNFDKQYLHFLLTISEKTIDFDLKKALQTDRKRVHNSLKEHVVTAEDGILLLILRFGILGNEQLSLPKGRFIFIDEMQDWTPLQVAMLRLLYPKANYTFCGDLNQTVFGNQTIVADFRKLFSGKEITSIQLTTSYRSTEEIMDFASSLLPDHREFEFTARHGVKPVLIEGDSKERQLAWLRKRIKQEKKGWRTAILTKDSAAAKKLSEHFPEAALIVRESQSLQHETVILPSFLAKGLEFDQVFLWGIDSADFRSEQDRLSLYTMTTRGMHEVYLLSENVPPILEAAIEQHLIDKKMI